MRLRALGALTVSIAVVGGIAPLTTAQAAVAPHSSVGTAPAEFYASSGDTSPIGGGATIDNTSPTVAVSADLTTITASASGYQLSLTSSTALAAGTYTTGISVTDNGSTCSTGSFTIIEIGATDVNATFSLTCYPGATAPQTVGLLRYNATLTTPVPSLPSSAQPITDPPNSGTTSANADEFTITAAPGAEFSFQPEDVTGAANVTVTGNAANLTVHADDWDWSIAAPGDQQLVPGTYLNVTEPLTGTNAGAGLQIGDTTCTTYGSFTIYQIASNPDGTIAQLNATYAFTCNQPNDPGFIGYVRYNATTPTPIAAFLTAAVSPVAGSAVADGTTNVTLTANGNATAGASYSYDFGDGDAATVSPSNSATKPEGEGTYPVAVTVTDAGQTVTSPTEYFTVGDGYHAVTPQRLLDTRNGTGGTTGPVPPNGKVVITLPSSITNSGHGTVRAVVFNLTVTQPTAIGLVTAYSTGLSQNPTTSNVNYGKGQTIANLVTVPVVPGGQVVLSVTSGGTEQLLADLEGYYTAGDDATNAGYGPVTPTRIMDTRHGTGGAGGRVAGGNTVKLKLPSSVPAGATAIVLNVTAVAPSSAGYVSAFPDGSTPDTSNVNYPVGATVPNLVIVSVPADRTIDFKNGGAGAVDILADLDGYFSASATSKFVPYFPVRLFDTRKYGGALDPYFYEWYAMAYALQVPTSALTAALYNVTVTQSTAAGYVSVVPDPVSGLPAVSNLNFGKGETIANSVLAPMTNGKQDFFNGSPTGSIQLLADFFGYFAKPVATTAPPTSANVKSSESGDGNAVAAPAARLGASAYALR